MFSLYYRGCEFQGFSHSEAHLSQARYIFNLLSFLPPYSNNSALPES